jgi:hypothetical protein
MAPPHPALALRARIRTPRPSHIPCPMIPYSINATGILQHLLRPDGGRVVNDD